MDKSRSTEALLCMVCRSGSPISHSIAASFVGSGEITALLLAHGADPNIRNYLNLTPFQDAKGEAREAYKLFNEGGVEALWKKWPRIKSVDVQVEKARGIPEAGV